MLIIFGIIILIIGIYHKFSNLKKNNNSNNITIRLAEDSKLEEFYVNYDYIIIKYKIRDRIIIKIYDLISGSQIKKIELLK